MIHFGLVVGIAYKEDLSSLEQVKEISQLELLAHLLPQRVGAPLSVNNLKQDLKVAFETADRWIEILENLYHCFRISPYGSSLLRTAKKEKKLYLWDWSLCEDPGVRFENLVACQLLKWCHFLEDYEGEKMELRFLRDAQKREVDFVVLQSGKPLFGVECKHSEKAASPHLTYFADRTPIPYFYQVHLGQKDYELKDTPIRVLPFAKFCRVISKKWLQGGFF